MSLYKIQPSKGGEKSKGLRSLQTKILGLIMIDKRDKKEVMVRVFNVNSATRMAILHQIVIS